MSIKTLKGDLLDPDHEFEVIVQGCNCFCRMNSGIARQIREQFPGAYDVDQRTVAGNKHKLGSFTYSVEPSVTIVNAYTQYNYGYTGDCYVSYDAVRDCMKEIRLMFAGKKIGMPQIGAGLGGGDWDTIKKIIEEELSGEDVTIVEYESNRKFSVILAVDERNGVGANGELPWHVKSDMNHFRKSTLDTGSDDENRQNVVIMGRKTWESIPEKFRPLKNRVNIVITSNSEYKAPIGVSVVSSLEEALEIGYNTYNREKVWVIGGARVYNEAFLRPDCAEVSLTRLHRVWEECDTFVSFPEDDFRLVQVVHDEENGLEFDFELYKKKTT